MNLIDDLRIADVINADDARLLNERIPLSASGAKLIHTLHSYLLEKAVPGRSKGGFSIRLYDKNITPEAETGQANILLNVLLSHQIITNLIWQKLQKLDIPNTIGGSIAALHMAGKLEAYYKNFTTSLQLAFADILLGKRKQVFFNGILQEKQFEQLKADIQEGKLNTYLDFFNYSYCSEQLMIPQDLTSQQVLDLLIPVINKLIYDSFSVKGITIAERQYNGHPAYNDRQVELQLNTGARWHDHTYTCMLNTRTSKISNQQLSENVLLLVNGALADFAAPYRFTAITNQLNPQLFPEDDNRYVLCRLEIQQASAVDFYVLQKHSLFVHPYPVYNNVLSYRRIEYMIYHFKSCGLLDHLNEHVIGEVVSGLQEYTYANADELLAAFPDTIALVDKYSKPNHPPFLQILTKLGHISRGVLNFTNIEDGTPTIEAIDHKDTYQVSFTCNGIRHSIKCEYAYGELYEGVMFYLSNEILRKSYPELSLLHLSIKGVNQYTYTVINQEQLKYLTQANIMLGAMRY